MCWKRQRVEQISDFHGSAAPQAQNCLMTFYLKYCFSGIAKRCRPGLGAKSQIPSWFQTKPSHLPLALDLPTNSVDLQ